MHRSGGRNGRPREDNRRRSRARGACSRFRSEPRWPQPPRAPRRSRSPHAVARAAACKRTRRRSRTRRERARADRAPPRAGSPAGRGTRRSSALPQVDEEPDRAVVNLDAVGGSPAGSASRGKPRAFARRHRCGEDRGGSEPLGIRSTRNRAADPRRGQGWTTRCSRSGPRSILESCRHRKRRAGTRACRREQAGAQIDRRVDPPDEQVRRSPHRSAILRSAIFETDP